MGSLSYLTPARASAVLEQVHASSTGAHSTLSEHLSAAQRIVAAAVQRMVEDWIADAACTTLNVAIGVAVAGALAALLLRRPGRDSLRWMPDQPFRYPPASDPKASHRRKASNKPGAGRDAAVAAAGRAHDATDRPP